MPHRNELEELCGDRAFEHAPRFFEDTFMPRTASSMKPRQTCGKKIGVEPLVRLPFGAHRIERLQEHGPQQTPRWDQMASHLQKKRREIEGRGVTASLTAPKIERRGLSLRSHSLRSQLPKKPPDRSSAPRFCAFPPRGEGVMNVTQARGLSDTLLASATDPTEIRFIMRSGVDSTHS